MKPDYAAQILHTQIKNFDIERWAAKQEAEARKRDCTLMRTTTTEEGVTLLEGWKAPPADLPEPCFFFSKQG